jgi:hypothetical protein
MVPSMAATEAQIPLSKERRRELKVLKAEEDRRSYDETLAALLDAYDDTEV